MISEITILPTPPLADLTFIMENLRDHDRLEASAMSFSEDPQEWASRLFLGGEFQWGAYLNGTPVATFGAAPRWKHVWTAWTLGTADFPRVALSVTKFIRRRGLPAIFDTGGMRVDTTALMDYPEAHAWLALLGAECECVLANWGKNGETFAQYRWLREATKPVERTATADMRGDPHGLPVRASADR